MSQASEERYACHPGTFEAEARGPQFDANLGYIVRLPKRKKKGWGEGGGNHTSIWFFRGILGSEPMASCMLGCHSVIELHTQPQAFLALIFRQSITKLPKPVLDLKSSCLLNS